MSELKSGISRAYSDLKTASQRAAEHLRANVAAPPPPAPQSGAKSKPRRTLANKRRAAAARPRHSAPGKINRVFFQRLRRIGRAVEHAQRFRVIVGVFLKYGYGDLAQRLPLPAPVHLPFRKTREAQEEIALLTPPQRLRRAFEELGPAFVKFGQLLSTRTHLLPQEFIIELAKLHDEVPPVPVRPGARGACNPN